MDTLKLKLAKRSGGEGKTKREYYDFIINKKSIREMIDTGDTVGVFLKNANLEWNNKIVNQILLKEKSELGSGRVPIYVCPECGDLGCGAVTVEITTDESSFIWSNFGYENNYEDKILEKYEIGPFRFDKTEYQDLFGKYIRNLNK